MSDYSDIVDSYKDMSVSELGSSLLQRKGEIAEKQRKRDKKDMRIQQALGVLLAGQGLMKNAFKRRQKELANQQTLDLLTADSDAKQIQNLSTIYNYAPAGYNSLEEFTKEINPETGKVYTVQENTNRFFKNLDNKEGYISKISPLIDQQLKFSANPTMQQDNPRAYNIVQEAAAQSLFEQMITDDNHIKYLNGLEKFFNDDGLTREDILKESLKLDKGRYSQYQRQKYARKEAELSSQGMFSAFGGFIKSLGDDQEAKGNLNLFKKLKPEDLQTPELREVLDNLNVRGIVLEAVDKGLQSSRQSPERYLNMVNNKQYEPLRTNMSSVVLLSLARDVDNDRVFERYGLTSYIDDGVFENLQKDISDDPSVKVNFEKRSAALSLRLKNDKQFALQLIKNAGAAGAGFRSEQAATFIKQLDNDEFRNKFAVLAVLQAGAYDPGIFSGDKFYGAQDPLASLGMERPNPKRIKTDMGYSDKQSADTIDPVLNPNFDVTTGEATQDYLKLSPRGKDNAWYSMALQVLTSKNGTEADKLQALEDLNNTTPNPRNLPVIEYLQVKEEEVQEMLVSNEFVKLDQIKTQINQTKKFIEKGGNEIMGTVIEASPKQIKEAEDNLLKLEQQRQDILSMPEVIQSELKTIENLKSEINKFETVIRPDRFNIPGNKFKQAEKEYNENKIKLDELENLPTTEQEVETSQEIDLDITEPKAVGEDVMKRAIEAVVDIQGVSDEYKQTTKNFLNYVAKAESNYGLNKNTFNNERDAYGPMQIIMSQSLAEIQRRLNPKLTEGKPIREYNELLKDNLNIDLMDVTKKDLEQPVVSAAVARAYFMVAADSIPTEPEAMADYYVDNYVRYDPKSPTYIEDREKARQNFLVNNGFVSGGFKQTIKSLLDFN